MFESLIDDLKREFRQGNMITRIILVNVAIFVAVNLVWIVFGAISAGADYGPYNTMIKWLSLSSNWYEVITRPWTILSTMFLHEGFMHILFNMLMLYWFGRIVGDLIGDHRILPLYLMGGFIGGLIYFLSANLLQYGAVGSFYALGASGAVMAIVLAAGVLAPDYIMRLILLGDVKLKYIVAVLLFVDLLAIGGNNNTGGHFAHLGGAAFGALFVSQLRKGNDLTNPLNSFMNMVSEFFSSFGQRRSTPSRRKAASRVSSQKKPIFNVIRGTASSDSAEPKDLSHQEKLDAILEKIKKQGYENLTAEEKEFLFNASNK